MLLNCFISGLLLEICRELAILHPYSIAQAIGMTKLVEDKIKDVRPKQFRSSNMNPNPITNPVATLTLVTIASPSSTAFPLKHFSATCMHEHRTQGLCYYCNEKFIIVHKCTSGHFLLCVDNDCDTIAPLEEAIVPFPFNEEEPMHFHFYHHRPLMDNIHPSLSNFLVKLVILSVMVGKGD